MMDKMKGSPRSGLPEERENGESLAVRFPLPPDARQPTNGSLPRLSDLLPRRWRRWVVIQGQHYWLPG
jgi:hypothetical protein